MPYDKIDQLYDALKADGAVVSKDRKNFRNVMLAPGKDGYQNRKRLFDALKADGAVDSNSYEEFAQRLGLHAVKPAGQKAPHAGTPMTGTEREEFAQGAQGIMQQAQGAERRAHNAADYAKGNMGLRVKPSGLGFDRKNVVQKGNAFIDSEGNEHNTRAEASITQGKIDEENEKRQNLTGYLDKKAWQSVNTAFDKQHNEQERFKEEHPYLSAFSRAMQMFGGRMSGGQGGNVNQYTPDEAKAGLATLALNQKTRRMEDEGRRYGHTTVLGRVMRGMGAGLSDAGTYDFGISDTGTAVALKQAAERYEAGKATADDEMLLEAASFNNEMAAKYAEALGGAYGAGQNLVGTASFMAQIASNPASATGKATANKVARIVARRAIEKYGSGLARKAVTALAKGATRLGADALEAGVVTGMYSPTKIVGDYAQRKTGDIYRKEDGTFVFEGREHSDIKALAKAINAQNAENLSEMWGDYLPGVGKLGGVVGKGLRKVGAGKIVDAFEHMSTSAWAKTWKDFTEKTKWNGTAGEYFEEVMNNVYNAITNGDMTLDSNPQTGVFNGKRNLDTLESVGLMTGIMSSIKTGGYMRAKYVAARDQRKADLHAREVFGNERWEAIKEMIDSADDKEMGNVMSKIGNDTLLSDDQKMAVLNYQYRTAVKNGANAQDLKNKLEGNYTQSDEAYDAGYNAEGAALTDAKTAYELQQQKIAEKYGEDAIAYADDNPVGYLHQLKEQGADEEVQGDFLAYINAKSAFDGVIQRAQDDLDDRITESDAMIDSRMHRQDGTIHPATMKYKDRKVYVVSGNVVMSDDGTMVDNTQSDDTLIIRDAETGELEFSDPASILSVDETIDPEEEKAAAAEAITQTFGKERADQIDGVLPMLQGDTYNIVDDEGKPHTVQVVQNNGDGSLAVMLDGAREAVPMTAEQLQAWADNANVQRVRQQEEEAVAALQPAEPEAETGNGRPTYSINDEITLRGEDGLSVRGSVGAEENADGLIEVYTESPIKGKKVNMFTRDELDGMLLQHNGEDVNAGMGVAGDAGAVERPQEDAQESAPANAGKSALQDGTTAEPMPMIGEGEDAEPDFSRVDPARAHTYIYSEAGLNRNEGDAFVAANLKEAQKALEKAKKGEPKMGTSIAKYKKEQAAYQQIVDGAQRTVDYWNGVKAEQDKIVAEESRMRAEQQAAETRQAIGAELQRKEEEARKTAEQAEVGTHNVAPAIKEKWDATRKIEGAANEIVLPNGEKVAGRYVLVESGAASPSHNATNEFTKTEGFPIDENGQSVNDRDYERDKDAQRITREIAGNYDSRALQSPVVVSKDGIVLSGNGRTMAGELAAANNTDGAYIEHLQKYPQQYGFTPEQVQGMEHPRVLFVPDADMPYTAETFAKYNQQEMKGQSKTEHAVKLGKVVDDGTFNRIIRTINQYDTLGDFYADSKATHDAIGELQTAGVVAPAQVAEMFDGDGISAQGREMLENMLIGKAFESNPDAVRQITAFKSMRQSVITALAEISNNKALGDGYSLEKELADAIALVYNARNDKYKAGERVSEYARQGNLFQLDDGATVADFTNATTMMLADVLNDNRSTQLKKILAVYNHNAADSAAGQMDMFSGGVLTKRDILNEVKQLINYGTEQQQTEAIGQAVERRKAESIQQDGDTRGSGEKEPAYRLSDEVDENGRQFVLTSEGKLEFGELGAETGLPPAPIMLSEGIITNPKTNDGYGLVHIEARHGEQIRNAGYSSVLDFIEEVAKHYEVIKEGKNRNGNQTYMLQLTDKHNNTLMVEMSADGNYWNINTAGIFKTSYGKNRKEVYNRHTTAKQPAGTVGVSQDSEQDGTQKSSSMNTPSTSSASKDSKSSEIKQKYEDIFAKAERIARESEVKRKITEAEKETDVNPTEGQKEAGNYKKGHVTVDGLDVTIEQPKGSVRRGKDADGKEWESEMHNTYGYIKGTEGVDGDHIDIFLSDNPASGHVFVVDQVNPKTGEFDEHKVMYGFDSAEEAKQAYLSNYEKGWKGLGDITEVTKEEFKKWIDSSKRKTKPFAEYAAVKTQSANRVGNKSSKDLSKSEKDVSLQSKSSEYENSRRNSQGTGRNRPKKLGENDAIGLRLESAGRESEKANGGSLGERIERERAAAEKFAAEHGALMSIDDLFSLGDIGPSGTESDTYFSRDGYVYKMNNLMHNPLVSDYLKRLSFHNKIFTNTPYELVGFVKSGKSLYPVVRQESVDFDRQGTKEEISSYMQSLGFVDDGDGVFHDGNYIIKDVKPKNVFVGKDGQIYVVDAEISEKANSPEVKQKKEDEVSEIPAMTEAEYLASKGLGSPMSDYMLDKMRIPHGETARQMAKRKQEAERAMEEHAAQKEAARKEYREKIANGELREPTKEEAEQKRIDALVKTANGHDDNPSVQAARRVLDKRGVEWKKNEDIFTRAERIAQDVANKKKLEKREPTKAGKIPQEEKEDLLSQKEYVDNGMSSALEQTQYKTLEEWEDKDTEDYARKYDDFLADYTNYINDFANGEKLQALYDKSSVEVQKEIRRHIEDAGLDYHDILDTSPGRIRIQDRLTKKMKYAKGEFSDGTIVAGEVVSQTPTSLVINSRGRKYTIKAGSVLEQSDEPIASGGILFRDGEQEYTEEEREVIANAKADGSYMKAPNGKSTKLTEHQWVQVRTKAFKEWFGDWEKAARIEKLRKSKAVKITGEEIVPSDDLKQYKKNALEYGKKLRGEYTNEDTGESIALTGGNSRGGIREILQHDYKDTEHLQSIAAIPQIIEKSIFIDDIPNEDVEKYSGVKSFRYYVCGLKIGNNDYTVKAVVAVQNNGERYYDHKLSSIEKGKLLSIIPTIQKAGIKNNLPPSIGKDKRLFSILQTNSSKVLDENGEPMVVYHGTNTEFTAFDRKKAGASNDAGMRGKGFYLSPNKRTSENYGQRIISAFVSLKNPFIPFSFSSSKEIAEYLGVEEDTFRFEPNSEFKVYPAFSGLITSALKDKGYDGVLYLHRQEIVAFRPDQIKSATDNNGEFDAGNDDIRFRKTEQVGYTAKQREEYDLRQRRRIQDAARETASKLGIGDRVTMMETADGLTGRRAKAKGWFDTETGKIVVVLGNHRNREDVMQTILHEGVAHYGLRQLFGPHFGTFLDNVLLNADEDVRRAIVEMAAKYGWDFRTATEEYLAGLAENTDFERAMDRGWFNRIKDLFLKMLHKIGFEGFTGVDLSDNELRYILWRSYENLTEPGRYRSILGEAADVDMQSRLKVGNYQVQQTGDGDLAAEPAPIGNGAFGPIYDQFRGKAKEAIDFLTRKKAGEAVGALHHKDIGDIDLVWGNGKAGLAHILSKHPNVLDGIQDFINEMEVVQSSENRIVIESDSHRAVISKMLGQEKTPQWLLTAYAKKNATGGSSDIDPEPNQGKQNGTAPLQGNSSSANIGNVLESSKESDEKVLFRSGEERDRAMARDEYNRMLNETSHKFTEAWMDSMVSLKKLQDAIAKASEGKIEDWENAYMAENAMSSTSQAEINAYKTTFFKDLVDAVNKLAGESSYEDVVKYVMAKHGLERNEKMAARDFNAYIKEHPEGTKTIDYFRNRDYSGLTALTETDNVVDAEMVAEQMVKGFEGSHNVTELWQAINAATKATLTKSYESGMIKKPEYEHIRDMFDYYVPLRGFDETTGDEVYNYFGGGHGIFNAPVKAAKGRRSLADDPFATIGNMAESAIMQGNRNKMKQKFLNLVLNHPSDAVSVNELYLKYDAVNKEWIPVFADNILPDDDADTVERKISDFNERMEQLVEHDAGNYKRGRDAVDIPYRVLGRQLNEHQVHVKKNGRDYMLTINGNPEAAQALNGQTNPDSTQNPFYKAFKATKNFMAAMFTQKNPAFLLGNLSRDAFYANSMIWVKEGANYALTYNKNWGKALIHLGKLIYKQKNGTLDRNNPIDELFYQFIMHGGETGYTFMNSVEDYKDTIAKMVKESRRSGWNPKTWIKFLDNQIDYLGRWAEDTSRFAAYMTSREMGRSVERSVWDAKEITVNFNKKGAGAKAAGRWEKGNRLNVLQAWTAQSANELYIFWNAGVQGLSNIARAGKAHPGKLTAMAMTYFTAGTLLPMLQSAIASAMGGDDDEYYNLPEWVRRSNLCIYTPNGWVTIPLPIELRAFYGLGELLQGQMSDATNYHSDELTAKALEQVSQLLPIDFMEGGGGMMAFVPSYAKPFVENAANKDWTGVPIYKKSDYNKNMPEWTKAYKGTSPELVALARRLNEISGGDKYTKGKIDVNPAEIEHLFEGYLGGLGSFVNQTKKTMMMPFDPNLREMRNVPIANKFFKAADERTKDRRVTEEYFRYVDEYDKTAQKVSGYTREAKRGIVEYAEKIDFLFNSPEYERYQILKGYKSSIDKIGQALKDAPDNETRTELEDAISEIRKEAVDVLRATEQ